MKKEAFLLLAAMALVVAVLVSLNPHRGSIKNIQRKAIIAADKKIPKKDRIDLAMRHEAEITKDPALGYVPYERILTARQQLELRLAANPSGKVAGAIPGISWTERGPDNVGGRTRTIMVDPNDPTGRSVFAAGVGGGIWKTSDITLPKPVWNVIDDLFGNIAVTTMAFNPLNTQEMYFGTGEGYFNADAIRGLGIWKSTNGGLTWNQLASTNNSNFYYVQRIAVHPVTGDVYAATRSGLFRSQNGGTSWTKVLGAGTGAVSDRIADIEIAADNSLYATAGLFQTDGVYKSATGNPGSWTKLNTGVNGFPATGVQRIELACAPSNPQVVYAITQGAGNGVGGIYRTTDGGANWTSCTLPVDADGGIGADLTRGQAWYDLTIAVDPNNENTVFVGGIDLFKSTNGGNTWQQISHWYGGFGFQEVHADQHWIYFHPGSSTTIYFGNDGGVYMTTNGTAAIPAIVSKNSGYNVTQFYGCAMHPAANAEYFLAGAQDNGSQQFRLPGMNSTIEVTGGDGCFTHIDQDQPQYQWTSYVYNNYFRSTNCGATWSSSGIFFGNTGSFVNPTDYDNVSNVFYAAVSSGHYLRWLNPQTGNTTQTVNITNFGSTVSHISVSQNTPNRVFFGLNNGRVVRVDNANTIASGSAGVWLNNGAGMPTGSVSCIAIQDGNDNHLLVTYSNYGVNSVWETTDGGTTWSNLDNPSLPDMPVRWALFNPLNPSQALIATELGVWSTDFINGVATVWAPSNLGLANTRVDMLQIRQSDNLVIAATHGRGLYSTDVFCNPYADFKAATTVSYTGIPVQFTDASKKATSWLWNFGDSNTSSLQHPSHSYSAPGIYTVTLTINGSLSRVKNNYIIILPNRGTPYTPAMGGNFDVNPNDFGARVTEVPIACAGAYTDFERGNSTQPGKNGTRSGSFAWVTGLNQANYANNAQAELYSPCFNFMTPGTYTLRFYRKNQFETGWDGMIVEYSTNRGISWTPLGNIAANWYDYSSPGTTAFPPNQPFFNNTQTSFTLCQWDVSFLSGNPSVSFRFVFKSDAFVTAPGIAIDDFEIIAPNNPPLPVNLIYFSGSNKGSFNLLEWATASETNNRGFEIQRSQNGTEFSPIGFISGKGTTSVIQRYSFEDHKILNPLYYYRLLQIDFDGISASSPIIAIKSTQNSWVTLAHTLIKDNIILLFNKNDEMPADVLIFDISGKKVFEISGMVMNSVESIPVSSLPKGSYILTVRSANLVKSFKIIRL
jgi:PKD repeat protein